MNANEINDKSMEVLENIADPYFDLMRDSEFLKLYMSDCMEAVKYACKSHKKEVVEIAAALKGVPVSEYVVDPFTLPLVLISAMVAYRKLSDGLFTSQAQSTEEASSGSATESTEANEQPINS